MTDIFESQEIPLEPGWTKSIQTSHPIEFVITTLGGTVVTGMIMPNNPLKITNQGDILRFEVHGTEETLRPLQIVKS